MTISGVLFVYGTLPAVASASVGLAAIVAAHVLRTRTARDAV